MATRVKKVEYAFDTRITSLAAATRHDFSVVTLTIPESSSRTFRSVIVEVTCHDNVTVAASITSWLIGIKLGAVAFNDVTQTVTLTNSGDNQAFIFTRDVTSYFNSNFGSFNAQTCQVGVSFGGIATLPITAKLLITYEYSDANIGTFVDSGTAESGANTTLTDSDKSWTSNAYAGWFVKITGGTGSGQCRLISSNTATVITIFGANWTTNPDSSSAYQIIPSLLKTVHIPIESRTAQETNTLTEIGTNQVPNLDSFLPETNKEYRQAWFESVFNNGGNATTDFNLALALDAEAEVSRGTLEMGLNSADWGKDIWIRNDFTTNATHAFKARSSTTARFSLLSTLLCVTYVYNPLDTTTVIQSLEIPFAGDAGYGHTSGQPSRIRIPVWIEEPATITLKQSGFLLSINEPANLTFTVDPGAQAERAYTLTSGSIQTGGYHLMHRIDSGGSAGNNSFTIARGLNNIDIDYYVGGLSGGSNITGMLYLNYTSGVHASGEGVHNHTTVWSILEANNATTTHRSGTPTALFNIPETNWFKNALGFYLMGTYLADVTFGVSLEAEVLSGETPGEGWRELYATVFKNEGELHTALSYMGDKDQFQRWSSDPDTSKLALQTSRNYKINTGPSSDLGLMAYLTYHSITFAVAGNITGYSGDGSGITVDVHRDDTEEKIASATSSAGGAYSATVFDNTLTMYAQARQDGTHLGRSDNGTAA